MLLMWVATADGQCSAFGHESSTPTPFTHPLLRRISYDTGALCAVLPKKQPAVASQRLTPSRTSKQRSAGARSRWGSGHSRLSIDVSTVWKMVS